MRKAESRLNEKVEGSRYIGICGTTIGSYASYVAMLDSGFATTIRELSVLLKQLHIDDTSLCIIIPERQKLLSWTSCESTYCILICVQIEEKKIECAKR